MRFNVLYARYAHLRVVLAVGLLLSSWLVQSCTPRGGSTPLPMHTTADMLAPADAAWGTTTESFAALRWPFEHGQTPTGAAARDMRELRGAFAQRWRGTWAKAIRAADPHHLLLEAASPRGQYPEVIAACAT